MRQRVFLIASAALAALALSAGCAEILGLEPPTTDAGGSAGTTTTTGGGGGTTSTGGSGGTTSTVCTDAGDCPSAGLPPCHKPACNDGVCGSALADDGELVHCYSGPTGTEDVGVCHGGQQTCMGGLPDGECNGESLPSMEDCSTPADEGCDGGNDGCSGTIQGSVVFSGPNASAIRAIAVGPDGSFYIAGFFVNQLQLNGCSEAVAPVPAGPSGFVAKLAPDFACQWIAAIGDGTPGTYMQDVAVHGDLVWAIGGVEGTAIYVDGVGNQGSPIAGTSADAVVLSLDEATGAFNSWYRIGGVGADYGNSIAASSTVYAQVRGATGQVLSSQDNPAPYVGLDGDDILVTAIDATTGKVNATIAYGSPNGDSPGGIAVTSDRTYIGGSVGPSAANETIPTCIQTNADVSRAVLFDTVMPDPVVCGTWSAPGGAQVASVWASESIVVSAGYSVGPTDLGCGSLTGSEVPSINGWFRVDKTAGGCSAHVLLPGNPEVFPSHAEAFEVEDTLLGGSFSGNLFGAASQGLDVFLARYPKDPVVPDWHLVTGSDGTDKLSDFVVSPLDGSIVAAGTCGGLQFAGKADCVAAGSGFLLRVNP